MKLLNLLGGIFGGRKTCGEIEQGDLDSKKPFFEKIDYSAFWISFLLSFVLYFFTAAPSVTLEDSGELAVAGDYLGVPHPPGYPIWTICAFVFCRILGFVTYMGQPNPAWAIAVMSGFFGSLAVGLTAMVINKSSRDILQIGFGKCDRESILRIVGLVSSISGSLVFAFSPVMWSQATIVEVYTLNAFFLMLIFVLVYKWICVPSDKLLWVTAFLFGLGFTNYQVLLFMAVPLVLAVMVRKLDLFRDFVLLGIPILLGIGLLQLGAEQSMPGFFKVPLKEAIDGFGLNVAEASLRDEYVLSYVLGIAYIIGVVGLSVYGYFADDRRKKIVKWVLGGISIVMLLCFSIIPNYHISVGTLHNSGMQAGFDWKIPALALIAAIVGLYIFAIKVKGGLWYATCVTLVNLVLAVYMKNGMLHGLVHPTSGFFAFYIILNFVYLGLAYVMLPNGRAASITVLMAELGAAFYAFMPIFSETNPPMNWGYPRTWEGFKHAVSRGQYEKINPITLSQVLSVEFVNQIGGYFTDLRQQFTLILAPLGFIPFSLWSIKKGARKFDVFKLSFGLSVAVAVIAVVEKLLNPEQDDFGGLYKYLVGFVLVFALIGIVLMVFDEVKALVKNALSKEESLNTRIVSGVCSLGVCFAILFVTFCVSNIVCEFILEKGFGIVQPVLGESDGGSGFVMYSVILTSIIFVIITLLYAGLYLLSNKDGESQGVSIKLNMNDVSRKWFLVTLISFFMMSVILIGMANPKGDIQDNFIQKVKFISSHGIFALWIGYGMAFALYLFRGVRKLLVPALVVVSLLALVPVYENYCNYDMVDFVSAAEQNGHDFGWQFGNYQLRGAKAINEELDAEEEPLPNPEYPLEMTDRAIFFGGTDPGRFVPTYMIFSAKVRPDVYLITQNALADPTYLDTMRFMYGDEIWIPTAIENTMAFNQYVDDVKNNRRPNLGGIINDGNRAQVVGAQAVMEINGILAEDMFVANKGVHDFYVEESYAIKWMYPYLTPHGLIFKLNNNHTQISQEMINDDMDFWDWYNRRLISRKDFHRDVAARKAFSKLRCALAGYYTQRDKLVEAERAFNEAILLYPYSGEAHSRYMSDILFRRQDIAGALLLLEKLIDKDVNNMTYKNMAESLRSVLNASKKVVQYLNKHNQNAMSVGLPSFTIDDYEQKLENIGYLVCLSNEEILDFVEALIVVGDRMSAINIALSRAASNNRQQVPRTISDKLQKPTEKFSFDVGRVIYENGMQAESIYLFRETPMAKLMDEKLYAVEDLKIMASAGIKSGNFRYAQDVISRVLTRKDNQDDWESWMDYAFVIISSNNGVVNRNTYESMNRAYVALNKGRDVANKKGCIKEFEKKYEESLVFREFLIKMQQFQNR